MPASQGLLMILELTQLMKNSVAEVCRLPLMGLGRKEDIYGVMVATCSKGKMLDYQVLKTHFKECQIWDRWQGTATHNSWKASHSCKINHKGSAGAIEAASAISNL